MPSRQLCCRVSRGSLALYSVSTLSRKNRTSKPSTLSTTTVCPPALVNFLYSVRTTQTHRLFIQGEGAPQDADPLLLQKEGLKVSNPSQFIPHSSKELQENMDMYLEMQTVFSALFAWIDDRVFTILDCCFTVLNYLLGSGWKDSTWRIQSCL